MNKWQPLRKTIQIYIEYADMPHIGNLYPSNLLLMTRVISVNLTECNIKHKCVVVALFNQEKLDVFGFNYSLSFGYLACRAFTSGKYTPDS